MARKAHCRHSRSDGIGKAKDYQVIVDIESGNFKSPIDPWEVVEARSSLYGTKGTAEGKAVYDRIRTLLKIKRDRPADYW